MYIHGKKQADNTYPRINFQTTNQNLIMDLSSPLAIYDLELEVTMGKGLVFSGNGYPLTIGENITCVNAGSAAEATAGTHSKFMLFGGQFNAGSSAPMNLQPKAMVNIMSGDWENVYGDGNAAGTLVNTEINLLGGHVYNLMSMHPEKGTTGNGVCNIYGGIVDTYKGHAIRDNQFDIANFYNGAESGVTSMTNSFAENATFVNAGVINKLTGTAPTLFQLADYDFTPEPPTFDDENGENGDDGEFEEEEIPSGSNTEKPETNTPETNAPATNAPETNTDTTEESGCGSVIGAGALVIAAVLGTAVAVGKKKEQ
ncbi:MAG: hypothetical protein J6B72_05200 [Clostridia bacterium]|nr:hypothetical protein [Clostridia bacterium]